LLLQEMACEVEKYYEGDVVESMLYEKVYTCSRDSFRRGWVKLCGQAYRAYLDRP